MYKPLVFKRDAKVRRRRTIRAYNHEAAAEALGTLEHGCEMFGFTKGQFSLINLIMACLNQTGPADIVVSTWTAARKEIDDIESLLKDGRIRSLKFLVDFSFLRRPVSYEVIDALREMFGEDSIRATVNHAKFCMITNETWNLVIRTSMNLNRNPRFENFEISDDPNMVRFLRQVIDDIFSKPAELDRRPRFYKRQFKEYGRRLEDPLSGALGVSLDDPGRPGWEFLS